MTELSHQLAAALYVLAALAGWRSLARRGPARWLVWLLGAGVLLHAVGFVLLHREDPPIPLESFPVALSLIGWLIAASYLLSLRFAHIRGVGGWVSATAALVTAIAWIDLIVGPHFVAGEGAGGAWSHAHVLLGAAGFSLLALASAAGLGYLAKERTLKHKSAGRFGLPSLESLDRMEHFTLAIGFPLLTLGVATGFVWSLSEGTRVWSLHAYWLTGAWAVYLVPIGLRVVLQWRGERPAHAVVMGFIVLAVSYVGIRLLGGGV